MKKNARKKFLLVRKIILQLVRGELWGSEVKGTSLPHPVFMAMEQVAEEQAVMPLAMNAVISHGVKLMAKDVAFALTALNQQAENNQKTDAELVALCKLLRSAEIPFFVVKGQTLAALYPHPKYRTTGDIDFYVPPTHFEQAKQLIEQRWQCSVEKDPDDNLHYAFHHGETLFEMHFQLMDFKSRRLLERFNELLAASRTDDVQVQGEAVPTLEPTMNVVYTFLHLYGHFMELGIGLRQLCDLAMLIHHHSENIDYGRLDEILLSLDVKKAFQAFAAYLTDIIGLQDARLESHLSPEDHRYVQTIDRIVWTRGNFGYHGWKQSSGSLAFYAETLWRRITNYFVLFRLSPTEIKARTLKSIPEKIFMTLKK